MLVELCVNLSVEVGRKLPLKLVEIVRCSHLRLMVFQGHELHYMLEDGMINYGSYDFQWESVFDLIGELKTENTVIFISVISCSSKV